MHANDGWLDEEPIFKMPLPPKPVKAPASVPAPKPLKATASVSTPASASVPATINELKDDLSISSCSSGSSDAGDASVIMMEDSKVDMNAAQVVLDPKLMGSFTVELAVSVFYMCKTTFVFVQL